MEKLLLIAALTACCLSSVIAQSCLPEGITFNTQAQIDNFQINYPSCAEIEGDVEIYGDDITNLNGINVVTGIGGNLSVGLDDYPFSGNPNLVNLSGLDNLTSIGGNLSFHNNHILPNLTGLDNLTSVGVGLNIAGGNISLQNLVGLEGLIEIGNLSIQGTGLIDLTGLDNVTTIAGSFNVFLNWTLKDFHGLENLNSIESDFLIGFNGNAMWYGNPSLQNFTGLESLSSVAGDFIIADCDSLISLTGLGNLSFVGGDLRIWSNPMLTTLSGLQNLTTIGGELNIGRSYMPIGNQSLTSLTGLENLNSIGGDFRISYNDTLTSLTGLDNINAGSIDGLYINYNNSIAKCDITSVCDYLASPNGAIEIHDNAPGCNSPEEVEDACDSIQTSVIEFSRQEGFIISPNPISSVSEIVYTIKQSTPVIIQILDVSGQVVEILIDEQQQGEQKVTFDRVGLKPGIYFCVLKTSEGILTKKIIKL